LEAAKWLWENTLDSDTRLREVVAECAFKHMGKLSKKQEFRAMMPAAGSFGDSVLKAATRSKKAPAIQDDVFMNWDVIIQDDDSDDDFRQVPQPGLFSP
jgi:hypothetical protein